MKFGREQSQALSNCLNVWSQGSPEVKSDSATLFPKYAKLDERKKEEKKEEEEEAGGQREENK